MIGDVSGKGVGAAGLTALARYTIRTAAMHDPRPVNVLRRLNEALIKSGGREHYLTAIYALVEPVAGGHQVAVAAGGHPQPLLLAAGGEVAPIEAQGTLLGWFERARARRGRAPSCGPGTPWSSSPTGSPKPASATRAPARPVTDEALIAATGHLRRRARQRGSPTRIEQRVLAAEGGELRDDATMVVVSSRPR